MTRKWPIVLMGWYLLAPPAGLRRGSDTDVGSIPLRKWVQIGAFDVANECQEHLEMTRRGRDPLLKQASDGIKDAPILIYEEARCVASDDPRLTD